MSRRPPRVCRCGRVVAAGASCPYVRAQKAERDRARPGARQRGYDTEFQKAAAEYLKAHPRCTCGRPAVLVRHKISIRVRPDLRLDPANWLPGCRSCNARDLYRSKGARP